jgi:hypothetical protein
MGWNMLTFTTWPVQKPVPLSNQSLSLSSYTFTRFRSFGGGTCSAMMETGFSSLRPVSCEPTVVTRAVVRRCPPSSPMRRVVGVEVSVCLTGRLIRRAEIDGREERRIAPRVRRAGNDGDRARTFQMRLKSQKKDEHTVRVV